MLGLGVSSMQDVAKEMSGVLTVIYSKFRYIGSTMTSVIVSLQMGFSVTIFILSVSKLFGAMITKGLTKF